MLMNYIDLALLAHNRGSMVEAAWLAMIFGLAAVVPLLAVLIRALLFSAPIVRQRRRNAGVERASVRPFRLYAAPWSSIFVTLPDPDQHSPGVAAPHL